MIKEILQRRTQKIDNEDVVQTLLSEIVDIGNASCLEVRRAHNIISRLDGILTASNQNLVCPVLIAELGCIAFPGFLVSD